MSQVRFETMIRLPSSENTAAGRYLSALKSLDEILQRAAKKIAFTAPVSFEGVPPDLWRLLQGAEPLWEEQLALDTLNAIESPRTFYVDQFDTLSDAIIETYHFLREVPEPYEPMPFVAPWPQFRVRAEGGKWLPLLPQGFSTKYIVAETQRTGFCCLALGTENRYAMLDEGLARWYVQDPKTGERLSNYSQTARMFKVVGFDGISHKFSATDLPEAADEGMAISAVASVLGAISFVALINHRSVKRETIEDPARPINRQQRRAQNYREHVCERVILSPRTSVQRAVAQSLRGENVYTRQPHWVRSFPRKKPSGGWTIVRPHRRAIKGLTPEQIAAVKPKDYDAESLVWHAAHGDI